MILPGKSQGDGVGEGRKARVVQSLRDIKRVSEVSPLTAPHPPFQQRPALGWVSHQLSLPQVSSPYVEAACGGHSIKSANPS